MIRVPLGTSAYKRQTAGLPEILMENRYFEANPTNAEEAALLSRPGTANTIFHGPGPYRGFFTRPGLFDSDLFFVAGDGLYRTPPFGTRTRLATVPVTNEDASFAASSGMYYESLYVSVGGKLYYYEGTSYATGFVAQSSEALSSQTLRIGGVYYKWRDAVEDVNQGDGSEADPYLIDYPGGLVPGDREGNLQSLRNLAAAINNSGERGTAYSANITSQNAQVRAEEPYIGTPPHDSSLPPIWAVLPLVARERGTVGNGITLRVVDGEVTVGNRSTTSPTQVTLSGGGQNQAHEVEVPEGFIPDRVASLNGFVLVSEQGKQRFYFIRPGERRIDPLDFESAESEPDRIDGMLTVGDVVWIFGASSMEAWYLAGDPERPVQRMGGMAHRIGAMRGTGAVVRGAAMFVGTDHVVYMVAGTPQRVSNHGIEERIRRSYAMGVYAWSFSLDGHEFYVLTINQEGTYVFDASTGQWHRWWSAGDEPLWNAARGFTWGVNIYAARWDRMSVIRVAPDYGLDAGDEEIVHRVTGITPYRERHRARCSIFRLYGEGQTQVTVRFSDDKGKTWSNPFTQDTSGREEVSFSSLGMIGPPGRVWEITDTGAAARIDGAYAQID